MYEKDRRIVITLDAGGTNFVFGAVQGDRFVVEPITLPSNSDRLDRCLETMVEGFRTVIGRLPEQPAAISFAFPGRRTIREASSADTCPIFRRSATA